MSRVGLPNLVAQSEQIARSRGSHVAAERAAQASIALRIVEAAEQRTEELEPADRVEALERHRQDPEEHEHDPPRHDAPAPSAAAPAAVSPGVQRPLPESDDAPGLRLDVRA